MTWLTLPATWPISLRISVAEQLSRFGKVVDSRVIGSDGRVCVGPAQGDYAAVRLRVRRGAEVKPPMQVHVRNGHLVGIVRVE